MTNKLTAHLLPTEDKLAPFGMDLRGTLYESTINLFPHHAYLVSDAPIKSKDWCIDTKLNLVCQYYNGNVEGLKKIEFTTDPKLIADGVGKIDGDTEAKRHMWYKEVNFLTEFCNRYNQKGNQKGVDAEKLIFDLLNKHLPKDTKWTIEVERGVQNAMKEALKSNAGGFSLEGDFRNFIRANHLTKKWDEYFQSLTPHSKGEMVIEYDKETKTLIFK